MSTPPLAAPLEAPASRFFELSTDAAPASERLDCWASLTGRFRVSGEGDAPVSAHVRGLVGEGIEFLDYRSRNLWMERSAAQCAADGQEQLSLGLVQSRSSGALQNGNELLLRRGDLYLIDFGRPVKSLVLEHHELALSLPRALVNEALGSDASVLGGKLLPGGGSGALLASHMRTLAAETEALNADERAVALRAARELALCLLQKAIGDTPDYDHFAAGGFSAALAVLHERCGDPGFNPQQLGLALGMSRATLYRLFDRQGLSVAGSIWHARLEKAHGLLTLPGTGALSIGEIAFRCGFLDQASFNRMFRRRYGMTPSELRAGRRNG